MSGAPTERFRQIDAVFDAALDLPANEQLAYIDRVCGGDSDMRTEVLGLLRAFHESEDFLETPAVRIAASILQLAPTDAPERLGPFRIVREIGRGGMGTVFLGERDDGQFEQRVALKVIQRTAPGIVRRFMTERRILALLQHPGIARLIDGGITAGGLPWFAMELIEGEPIDRYCATHELGVPRVLALFADVCDAISYAHRHLVIHRDLKPSNILVTAEGRAKLLDFGIAMLLDATQTAAAGVTRTELLALTPEFAAPEQVLGEPVSTATDVYSLGVLLYLLLSGVRPYDVRGRPPHDMQRLVCVDDPRNPSERASAERRHVLRGDLDMIVMKALRKDPAQRYASVQELSDDIRRHLSGHPVHARRPTLAYRAERFARRHVWSLAAGAAIVLLLTTYAVSMTIQQSRIRHALAEAQTGAMKAEQVTEFMLGLFQASEQGQAFTDTVTARQLLSRGIARARELSGQPEVRAQMLDAVGHLHMQLGEFDRARTVFEEARGIRSEVLPHEHRDMAASLANVGAAAQRLGDFAVALRLGQQALSIRRRTLGDEHPATLESLYWYAHALHESGDPDAADPHFEEWSRRVAAQPPERTSQRATQYVSLGHFLAYRGQYERAVRVLSEALDIRRGLFGERHPDIARALGALAGAHMAAGHLEEAERLERESVAMLRQLHPDGHPDLASALRGLAVSLHRMRRLQEAEPLYLEQLAMVQRFYGTEHMSFGTASEDLGLLYHRQGRYVEAEGYLRAAVGVYSSRVGEQSLLTKRAEVLLGDVLRRRGDVAAAEPLLLNGYAAFNGRRIAGFDFALRVATAALAELYEEQGRATEAARYRSLMPRDSVK